MTPKNHLAHAKLRLGDCFRHLGDKATARLCYEELMAKHTGTNEAKLAKDRLDKLKWPSPFATLAMQIASLGTLL